MAALWICDHACLTKASGGFCLGGDSEVLRFRTYYLHGMAEVESIAGRQADVSGALYLAIHEMTQPNVVHQNAAQM